jgi:hypothetical protein
VLRGDRLQQRPRQDEALGEEYVVLRGQLIDGLRERIGSSGYLADLVFQDLRVQQLLGVLPFVERLGFVQPFVALQADEFGAEAGSDDLGQLGFADAGRPLDEQGFAELGGQIDHRRDVVVANVLFLSEPLSNIVDGSVQVVRTHYFTSKMNDAARRAEYLRR